MGFLIEQMKFYGKDEIKIIWSFDDYKSWSQNQLYYKKLIRKIYDRLKIIIKFRSIGTFYERYGIIGL